MKTKVRREKQTKEKKSRFSIPAGFTSKPWTETNKSNRKERNSSKPIGLHTRCCCCSFLKPMFANLSWKREKTKKRSRNCWNSRTPKTPPRCIYMNEFIFLTKETCYRLRLQNVSGRRMVTMMKMMKMVMLIARNHKRRVRCTVFPFFSATAKPSRDSASIIKLVPTFEGLILREKEPKFSERERERERECQFLHPKKWEWNCSYEGTKWMMQMMMEILPLPKSMFCFWIRKR